MAEVGADAGIAPEVLIVDDRDEDQTPLVGAIEAQGLRAYVLHPEAVEVEDIRGADLVLVDYQLENWPERDGVPAARRPRTGISLLAVLRDQLVAQTDRPVGFALNTSQFGELPSVLPRPVSKHALARANNFEWVFDKTELSDVTSICSLAQACRQLPDDWEDIDALTKLLELLALPAHQWNEAAVDDLLRCRPPVHELSESTDGLALLRWFLHRILPYPCFLYGEERLAVRLGTSLEELRSLLQSDGSELSEKLSPTEYRGVLASFSGRRWWAAGVEAMLWDETAGESFLPQRVRDFMKAVAGSNLRSPVVQFPVLAIDDNYEYVGLPVELEAAVRIQPDDWPPYADDAWAVREQFDASPRLQMLALPSDA